MIFGDTMKKIVLFFIPFLFLVSCQSTGFLMAKAKVTMINEAYQAKSEDAPVEIYMTVTPDNPYIEIAQITCDDTEDDWCLKQIKIKARELGADGVIILGKSASGGVGVPIGSMYYVSSSSYGMKAIAFKYN